MGSKNIWITVVFFVVVVPALVLSYQFFQSNGDSYGFDPIEIPSQVEEEPSEGTQQIKEGNYGVSASHPIAVQIGMQILENGGNAVDASIAVSYALGVVEPFGSGIGGGGAAMIYDDSNSQGYHYDYRDMFPASGTEPHRDAGIPGFVKGMEEIHQDFGSMDMEDLLFPSIYIANNGFEIDDSIHHALNTADYKIYANEAPQFYPNGASLPEGDTLVQEDLARTMEHIVNGGSEWFYNDLAMTMSEKMGVPVSDFHNYDTIRSEPLITTYNDNYVLLPPPPLAGATLGQMLSLAEEETMSGYLDTTLKLSTMKELAYQDRLDSIADPDFEQVNGDQLLSDDHIQSIVDEGLNDAIVDLEGTSAAERNDHNNTTHFVVRDDNGLMVSMTNTLSDFYGSGIYVDGFFLNNQVSNFNDSESSINRPEAGKRSRSFMTPTIVLDHARNAQIGIGSSGGKRIPLILSQVLVHHLDQGMPLQEAVELPRFFNENHVMMIEPTMDQEDATAISNNGFYVESTDREFYFGGVQGLQIDSDGQVHGVYDPRREGHADVRNGETTSPQ